jgi:L-fuconolactonase
MLALARRSGFVLGVVGWIDLEAGDAAEQVRRRSKDELFVGVRPMLQDISQPDWILRRELEPAFAAITREALVFDALILSHQVRAIEELAARHPDLSIVLDHGAKPRLGDVEAMAAWKSDLSILAARRNVCCKLSGLLTELPAGVGQQHLVEAIGILINLFGPERLIWGSDWPVLTLAASYQEWFAMARARVEPCGSGALAMVFGGNAAQIYRPAACMRC